LNFIKNPFLYLKYLKNIHFHPINHNEFAEVLHGSNFTIDYVYNSQTGISLRCFEACASKTKIITNNPCVYRNKHFNEMNTVVFTRDSFQEEVYEHYNRIKTHIPEKYARSVSDFVSDLLV